MSQKTALFYKYMIRNAKLRKLTSVDFFKKKKKKKVFDFWFFSQYHTCTHTPHNNNNNNNNNNNTTTMTQQHNFFLPYKILWGSTIGNILILYLGIFFQFFFCFQFFFSNVPNEHVAALWHSLMSLFIITKKKLRHFYHKHKKIRLTITDGKKTST